LLKLFYQSEKKEIFIADFNPIFADENVKKEIKIIVDELDMLQEYEYKEIVSYLSETYGNPNVINLNEWLKKNFEK